MGSSTVELEREVAKERLALSNSVAELEARARKLTDWRARFAANPLAMLAVAFGGGILLSVIVGSGNGRPRRPNEAVLDDEVDDDEVDDDEHDDDEEKEQPPVVSRRSRPPRRRERPNEAIELVKGAVVGMATTRAIDYLEQLIPGLGEQVQEQRVRRAYRSRR